MRSFLTVVGLFVAAILVIAVVLTALQRQLIFPASLLSAPDAPDTLPTGARQWWLEVEGGRVEGWYLPGEGRSADSPGPAVMFAHGNGELIDQWPDLLRWYARRGVGALLVEYRDYGRSEGTPSIEAVRRDMQSFRDRLTARPEVDPSRLILHGRSLGGGAVCATAEESLPAALILQSTFTSIADLAWDHYRAPSFLVRADFDNRTCVETLDAPILITHGARDEVVPVRHGRRLRDAADRARYLELDCGHNDCPTRWDEIADFLREHDLLPAAEPGAPGASSAGTSGG
ncbi:MAG: alpha/beta hydrolase [Bradymonadaceae bacterium]